MPRPILAEELDEIEGVVRARPGVSSAEIAEALAERIPQRTLQYRLKRLVDDGRLVREGGDKAARYRTPEAGAPAAACSRVRCGDRARVRKGPCPVTRSGKRSSG